MLRYSRIIIHGPMANSLAVPAAEKSTNLYLNFFLSLLWPSGCSLCEEQLLLVWERRLERLVVLGAWLDLKISMFFSNLNDSILL